MKRMAKRKKLNVKGTIRKYLQTTTLHGFKYLTSEHCLDVIGWLICCCISACCAGVLCTVFWDRFQQIPALITLQDLQSPKEAFEHHMPTIAVCPPVESIAELFVYNLTNDTTLAQSIPLHLARIIEGKSVNHEQHHIFDQLLANNNVTLQYLMYNYMPPCHELIKKCRWQRKMMACDFLFEKMLTSWGICCVMQPEHKLKNNSMVFTEFQVTRTFDLALQCSTSNRPTLYGCKFATQYDGEEINEPVILTPGYNYIAQLSFTSTTESTAVEKLVKNTCVSAKDYTTTSCLANCAEEVCNCRDPLGYSELLTKDHLPVCNITQLACLKSSQSRINVTCECSPSCKKIISDILVESSPMDFLNYTYDPIYSGLNASLSIVIHLDVNIALSTLFTISPTETWLTLLSSLGGVFNMFLGVGLFSALELLFLLFVQIPKTMKKAPEKVYPKLKTRY